MALINPPLFLSEIRGKLGDYVFSRNRGGAYVRTLGTYTDPGSASQLLIRSYLTKAVEFWQYMTDDCRLAWTTEAIDWNQHMNHFRRGNHVGYNYFISSFIQKCISDGFPFNNLVLNGEFNSDTAWIKGAGWSISSGTANQSNSTLSNFSNTQANLFSNEYIFLQFEVKSITTGSFAYFLSSLYGSTQLFGSSVNTFNRYALANYPTPVKAYFQNHSNCTGSVDNAFVMRCNQYPSDIL